MERIKSGIAFRNLAKTITGCFRFIEGAWTFTHALTECLNKREKCSTSRRGAGASYQTSFPGISARAIAFGRSWPFAAFCNRPRLPVRHWGRDMSAPKPYKTNPKLTLSSRPPLSLQFSVTFRWLIYWREKSFYLSYGKHWSRRLQSARMRPAEGNIHSCINFFRITIQEPMSSRHYIYN